MLFSSGNVKDFLASGGMRDGERFGSAVVGHGSTVVWNRSEVAQVFHEHQEVGTLAATDRWLSETRVCHHDLFETKVGSFIWPPVRVLFVFIFFTNCFTCDSNYGNIDTFKRYDSMNSILQVPHLCLPLWFAYVNLFHLILLPDHTRDWKKWSPYCTSVRNLRWSYPPSEYSRLP